MDVCTMSITTLFALLLSSSISSAAFLKAVTAKRASAFLSDKFVTPPLCEANAESMLESAFIQKKPVVFHISDQCPINDRPIEKISHHIWLSNHADKGKSKEVREKDFQSLLSQYAKMDKDDFNFRHIFWVNDENLIPFTVQKLQSLRNVEVININSLQNESQSLTLIKNLLEEGIYGVAIDLTKYEVLRIFGGIVLDLNYKITTSNNLSHVLDAYSFIGSGNIGYGRINIENSMIAASKNHPILTEICDMINSELSHYSLTKLDNLGATDKFYSLFSQAVINNLSPYKERQPEEIMNKEGRANSPCEELIGMDRHANSWLDNP